ncbi:uncharacterized protein LOC121002336 [Bufo bufo]|uniref:uncharacterized protein LOC121002336 n=1 Tax=Bufo bufo TaxID=8384 RepID=UPI001ABDF389|nr:uncharacterized protein LOC121002336 [Bufo bufo]
MGSPNEEPDHDCITMMEAEVGTAPSIQDTPLQNPHWTLFVDGSRYADDKGKFHTGMAVTSEYEVLCARQLRPDQSAQEAELIALTEACLIAKDSTANIYTDSRYAFGVVHDFGVIWKARDYITAAGTPIKHALAVEALMAAVLLPTKVAVIKVKAHTRADTPEAKGNALADQAAKQAAMEEEGAQPDKIMLAQKDHKQQEVSWDLLKQMQKQATRSEKETWMKESALEEESGLWTQGKKVCLPRALYPIIASVAHDPLINLRQ